MMCELFLASKLHMQNPDANLSERYRMIGQLCNKDNGSLPRLDAIAAFEKFTIIIPFTVLNYWNT